MSSEPRPAATVVLIRDGKEALELLLLERNTRSGKEPRPWVFPGGKIDDTDRVDSLDDSARRAAVREVKEEAGLRIAGASLVSISRWITPKVSPKRFDTWFFLGQIDSDDEVAVDGGEIRRHRWLHPLDALEAHDRGEMLLAPPTYVTVAWLVEHESAAAALGALRVEPVLTFRPRICVASEGTCILYPGDAGYDDGDPARAGRRHRLWMRPEGWAYERSQRGR